MTDTTPVADLIERIAEMIAATSGDAPNDLYRNAARAILHESGHARLVAALKEAIAELSLYSAAVTGESFNKPAWNDALRKAGATP